MKRLALAAALLLTAAQSWAADMTPAEAFEAGKAFGLSPQGAEAVMKAISGASAADSVPYYDTANANSIYYGGGVGDPLAPGNARVTECSTVVYQDAKQQVECDAINDVAKNRAKRPPLVIAPNDPILVMGNTVKADPASVAGAFGGAYTACSTVDIVKPATYEEEICNEFKSLGEEVCHKTLVVTPNINNLCVPGTYENPYTYATHDVGGETWTIDSFCAGGNIRVRCWSGGSQTNSFQVNLGKSDTAPVYGTSCWPHTKGKYSSLYRLFYYSHQNCDPGTDICTAILYDVPYWDQFIQVCPAGTQRADTIWDGGSTTECYKWVCEIYGKCRWQYFSPTTAELNIQHTWTQQFHRTGQEVTFTDSWNNQCAQLEARTQ